MSTVNPEPVWASYLREANRQLRRNDVRHGMTFDPETRTTKYRVQNSREVVQAYLDAFGWSGIGEREIIQETKLPRTTVKRALAGIHADGLVTVTETLTRGKDASKRKVYTSLDRRSIVENREEL